MPTISARFSDEEFENLEEVVELLDEDTSTTVRKALNEGLRELRVRRSVERYQSGDASASEAARLAGVSLAEWLEIARERTSLHSSRRTTSSVTPTPPASYEALRGRGHPRRARDRRVTRPHGELRRADRGPRRRPRRDDDRPRPDEPRGGSVPARTRS